MKELILSLKSRHVYLSIQKNELVLDFDGEDLSDELVAEIRNHKEELIEYLTKYQHQEDYNDIIPVNQQDDYALSSGQLRLWILSQFEGGSAAYNIPFSFSLDQDIQIDVFKKAIYATINRHEILRTIFVKNELDEPRQKVQSESEFDFSIDYVDYRGKEHPEEMVQQYIRKDSYTSFSLETGPLIRISLLQTGESNYVFYYNMHHIISDGWSVDILYRDVLIFYEAFEKKEPPVLPELRIHYKDYASWQLQQTQKEEFKEHREYWKSLLSGELPLLDLPTQKFRPKIKTYNGLSLTTCIDEETCFGIKQFVRNQGGTLFMGLLAAWNVLFQKYTGTDDIILGSPIAGRDHSDLTDQIGFYVNTLVLRSQVDPNENFRNYYSRVKESTLTAYTHQAYPFDRVVEDLDSPRNTSRSAVFDVLFVLQNASDQDDCTSLTSEAIHSIINKGNCVSMFDATISMQEVGKHLTLNVVFNPDVYETELMEGLIRHYKSLLSALLINPELKMGYLDYLNGEEKVELLHTFNDTRFEYPENLTVVDLVEAQARKTPDATAIVFENHSLSYSDLNETADKLAAYLAETYTIKADERIAFQLERSHWMVMTILAILKSGAAYVPIDPTYPSERKERMLADSGCKVCLTGEGLEHILNGLADGKLVAAPKKPKPSDLAYVIYTSGSTGKPKGIMMEHHCLTNLLCFHRTLKIEYSRVCQFTSISFDVSFQEIFTTLCSGGELHVLSEEVKMDPELLIQYLRKKEIRTLFLPTSFFKFLISDVKNLMQRISCVEDIVVAGEQLVLTDQFMELLNHSQVRLHNHYGPAETHVVTTFTMGFGFEVTTQGIPPIGKPIANTQIYILNDFLQLQPKGILGVLYIGGESVSRGYLNQEDLTRERFVPDFSDKDRRMYKTGDRARWLSNGNIEYAGRADEQVKIRGFRIEPAEIEHVLGKAEDIGKVVILTIPNPKGEKELVAYFTATKPIVVSELRAYLKKQMPDHMIPLYFIQVSQIPLTQNGKIDRKALPLPNSLLTVMEGQVMAPRNDREEKLIVIWKEILFKDSIGIQDDFFELGGHSLKAIRVINKIGEVFQVRLPITSFFENPTIALLAVEVERKQWLIQNMADTDGLKEDENTVLIVI
jgi:amino acid adenylation domain-containing protein